ncbi:MAG: hypothetical protein EZS28_004644, partial [Streblomastix strix]
DPSDIEFSDVDATMKKITKKQSKCNSVTLSQDLEDKIWSLETIFNCVQYDGSYCVGIVQDSYVIPVGMNVYTNPHQNHLAVFSGKQWTNGGIRHKMIDTFGNIRFTNNQIVKLEFDTEKGTLIFFIDGVQQPVYISGIKEKVRFFV